MTSRQQKLLKELLQHSEYRTLNEYAHFFGTSGKTISKDLDVLETVIQQVGAKLIRKQGVGVKLKMSPQQAMALHQLLQESATMEDCDTGMILEEKGIDCVLLGPQVRHLLEDTKERTAPYHIPVAVIDSVDYGMMDGEKVL